MRWLLPIWFCVLIINCNGSDNTALTGKKVTDYIENNITNPFIVITRGDKRVVEANSLRLLKSSDEDALLVGNVKADFFNEEGLHISVMYSDSALINERNNNLDAKGNVTVVSDSGFVLKTQHLLWDNQYKLVTTDDSVMFTTSDRDTLFGIGFESDMDLTHYKVLKPHGITRHKSGD